MAYTQRYGFKKLNVGENISDDSYKFSDADRDTLDLLAYLGAEGHHHAGGGAVNAAPAEGLIASVVTTSGVIPSGRRVFYKYTLVAPSGAETGPSPEVFVDTPPQVAAPAKPGLTFVTNAGALLPGNYYYVLSAYSGVNNFESPAENPEYIFLSSATGTNTITLTLPPLPPGAQGFNIYRQAPDGPGYFYLASLDMTQDPVPTEYVDDGGVEVNCDRTRPLTNTTRQTNSVVLSVPQTLPAGWSYRIYRTFTVNDYTNSLLVTQTASPWTDTGTATTVGQPPLQGISIGSPERVMLTDMAEVQGALPLAAISAFPTTVTFTNDGDVFTAVGTNTWVLECPQAIIVGVRASLGRGFSPEFTDVIVDVNRGTGTNPTMTSIFSAPADRPRILVGQQIGVRVPPTAGAALLEGDCLTVDIDQDGGSLNDQDLTVNIYMVVGGYTETTNTWETP